MSRCGAQRVWLTLLAPTVIPLNQFHFHSPSEHSINGVHYPLEMHMVHKLYQTSASNTAPVAANTNGAVLAKAAVIGIMFAYECGHASGLLCNGASF